ncbi:MAG: hypothetical protein HY980_02020 [Candidatus Magasanikbacteria bacterium]|nr:hypothetical protein [Candidatus Magasanikbacteria bacterium]
MPKISKKITKEKLAEKIGAKNLTLVLNNVYCAECGPTAMVDYKNDIVVEPSGDTMMRGKCKKCGHKVVRLLETGETKQL